VCYAKDAMTGLRLMNELMDPATREIVGHARAISACRVIPQHVSRVAGSINSFISRSPVIASFA